MAKKKARSGFNMSEEIRNLLRENANQTSTDVYKELVKRFPNQQINRGSVNVAFSHARRKLGLKPGKRKAVRRRRPGAPAAAAAARRTDAVNITLLKAARKFVQDAGSPQAAINAIQQIESLQIGS